MSQKQSTLGKNWPKHLLQWAVLLSLIVFLAGPAIFDGFKASDPEKYCPMGGLQALATFLFRGSLPCSMSSVQIVMGLALAAAVILFSKLFCSYLCPLGTIEDVLSGLHKKLNLKPFNPRNGGLVDSILRIFKYVLLFVIFYSTMTASELFCKNLDPYYAIATGFKGEITLWMSVCTLVLLLLGGLIIDRFWCKYICPLGAISNTFKFWVWVLVLFAVYYLLDSLAVVVPLWLVIGLFCVLGYIMEVFVRKPKLQILHIVKNNSYCNHCKRCDKICPYQIPVSTSEGIVKHVDCTLCGECSAVCKNGALYVGLGHNKRNSWIKQLIPALLAVIISIAAVFAGKSFEIPTINETWGIETMADDSTMVQLVDPSTLETLEIENLTSVKCFGSSMAFKSKLQKIRGVHGVKTFVKAHRVVITYDPKVITPEILTREIYVPTRSRIVSPDWTVVPEVKVTTIRTENMFNSSDVINFANQFRFGYTNLKVFGIDSQYDCPLIINIYSDPSEDLNEDLLKEIVEKKSVDIYNKDGELFKQIPVDFEFVKMEEQTRTMDTREYLEMMFDEFSSGYFNGQYERGDSTYVEKRSEHYADKPWKRYEIVDMGFEKPVYKRSFPFVSNWLSSHEGVISVEVNLNADYLPALMVTYTSPMTEEKIWELLTMETWTIHYSKTDIREEPAKIKFAKPGVSYPVEK